MFLSYKKFQAHTSLCFWIQMNEKWLYGPENCPGLSRNGLVSSRTIEAFDRVIVSDKVWRLSTLFAWIILVSEEFGITVHPGIVSMKQR